MRANCTSDWWSDGAIPWQWQQQFSWACAFSRGNFNFAGSWPITSPALSRDHNTRWVNRDVPRWSVLLQVDDFTAFLSQVLGFIMLLTASTRYSPKGNILEFEMRFLCCIYRPKNWLFMTFGSTKFCISFSTNCCHFPLGICVLQ